VNGFDAPRSMLVMRRSYSYYLLAHSMKLRCLSRLITLFLLATLSLEASADDFLDRMMMQFSQSEIVFQRAESNAPFLPLASANYKRYNDTKLKFDNQPDISIDQTTFAQSAILPILATPKDIAFVGEWINSSNISSNKSGFESFDVTQAALPIGWLRQINQETQVAGFIAPLGYKATLDNSDWDWQTLGGLFARHVYDNDIWWAFGAYFDVGGIEDTYLPYLGAFWQIDEQWSVSAIMPWPAVLFAPTKDTFFRIGASPTGSSWQIDSGSSQINQEISGWDFGVSAEQRVFKNLWLNLETGLGGLRALRINGSHVSMPDFKVDASSYIK
ncbi:hypothetical protein A3765_18905, partial [Oleiphilus sp. HI0130]